MPICMMGMYYGAKPYVIRGALANLEDTEKFMSEQKDMDKSLYSDIKKEIALVRADLFAYEDASIPFWLDLFIFIFSVMSISLLVTGILLLFINPLGRTLAFVSSSAGVSVAFLVYLYAFLSLNKVFVLASKLSAIRARIAGSSFVYPNVTIQKFISLTFFDPQIKILILCAFISSLAFALLVFFYFNRPKVKELFLKEKIIIE